MQLHGWGPGGGGSDSVCFWGGGPHVYDLDCTYAIRLAQADALMSGLPMTGMASAVDGCEADAGGATCNLHPGFKTGPTNCYCFFWEGGGGDGSFPFFSPPCARRVGDGTTQCRVFTVPL